MPLINNLERVAALLYRQEIIDLEQLKKIRESAAPPVTHHKRRGRAAQSRTSVKKENSSAIRKIDSLKLGLGDEKTLDEENIMRAIALEYGLEYKKLDPLELDAETVTGTVPKPFALKHSIVPLYGAEDVLTVAVTDPEESEAIEHVKMVTGLEVTRVVSAPSEIEKIIKQFFGFKSSVKMAEMQVTDRWAALGNLEQLSELKAEDEISSSDKAIQTAVEFLLKDSLEQRASDVHIEPKRNETVVRMRIDGVLMDAQKIPKAVHNALISRIKLLARLDISEKRRPQDGRIKVQQDGREVEMRVSVLPVAFGEKIVIRIFDAEMAFKGLDELGFFPEEIGRYRRFLEKPHGIILVTGPTGSGKTSTLYSSLQHVASAEKNVVTIEDPIEMVVPQFNQVGVQPNIEVTFASALRAVLRQDPDIIMIGEIRDKETAANAVQAALTGHLVFSTLHTNDTVSSISRLYDLAVEPYQASSALIGIVAQRLMRVICTGCKTGIKMSAPDLAEIGFAEQGSIRLYKGDGCEHCRFTGYYGRTGVHEVLEVNENIRKLINRAEPGEKLRAEAGKAGTKTLWENAVRKVTSGLTTLEEARRIFSE